MSEPNADRLQKQIEQLKSDLTFELQRRERPDRHPYQVGSLTGFLSVSISQALIGVPPESALHDTASHETILVIAISLIVGSIMCLFGAYLSRDKHFELSVRVGIWGHLSIFFGCLAYTAVVIASTEPKFGEKPYWLSVTSVVLSLAIAWASVQRFRQMRTLLKEWLSRNRNKN